MTYLDGPIKTYLDDLAARKASPGGGSAAALGAATGVALMEMVANYTEKTFDAVKMTLSDERKKLEVLIDEDAKVYGALRDGEKKHKKGSPELERLYKESAAVPFGICKVSYESLKICEGLAEGGNRNLITDTAIAAIMLEGAFFSAKYNVYANLKYVNDNDYIGRLHGFLAPLEDEVPRLKEEILHKCEEVISK